MSAYPAPLARLVQELSKLPGIGEKTAARLAFHMLKGKKDDVFNLAVLGTFLHHPDLAIPLNDIGFDFANMLIDQSSVVLLTGQNLGPCLADTRRTE